MTHTDEQIEVAARSDAAFDGRPWESMGRADRERYLTRSRAALEAAERAAWRSISEAPKDRPILAWCNHEADPFYEDDKQLTIYAAHAEGLGHAPTGYHIIEWGGGWSDSYDDGGGCMPDWWFVVGSEFEVAANPTHFRPLSTPPKEDVPE